ncbi:hypothetical protein T08_7218 [Trichinella sp. T8]|nr:hypothetical protein T08_7218 [Trichinella sp. T8]
MGSAHQGGVFLREPNGYRTLHELHDELVTHVITLRALNRDTAGNQFASDIILTFCKRLLPKKMLSLWEDKILETEEDPDFLRIFAQACRNLRTVAWLKTHRLCFCCLRQGHWTVDCKRSQNSKNVTSIGLHRLLSGDRNSTVAEENGTSHGNGALGWIRALKRYRKI